MFDVKSYRKQWYEANKEKVALQQREYYLAHKKEAAAYLKRSQQ
jgi:hypothetical protein